MPKLPIDTAPSSDTVGPGLPGGPNYAALPPAASERVVRLRAGDEAIERELTTSETLLAGKRSIAHDEATPGAITRGYADGVIAEVERKNAEMLQATPVALRPALKAKLDATRDDLGAHAAEAEATGRAVRRRVALRNFLDVNAALVRLDVPALDGANQRAVVVADSLDVSAETRNALKAHMRTVLGNAALDGLLDDPADAQAALAAGYFDEYLDAQVKAERSAEIAELLNRQQVRAAAQGILALSLQAKAGALDEAALDAAVAAGRIGVMDAARLRSLDENARAETEARRAGVARVAAADGPLDPDSAEDRAAVDAYWDTVKDAFVLGDPAAAREAELFFALWKKILPSPLRRKYEGMLLSDDPALIVSGAQAIAALDKRDGLLTRDIAPDRVRLARAVADYAELGLTPGEAVARAREDVAQDDAAPEEIPGLFGDIAAPSQVEREPLPAVDVGIGATAAADRDLSNRVFGTAKGFIAFLQELQALPADEVADRARAAGLAGNLGQIALDILDAAGSAGDTREAQLQAIKRDIDQLPNANVRTKKRLNDLLTDARGIFDDPEKLLRALAVNRGLFRGPARLANVDPDAVEAERFASFQRHTGLIARPVTATLTPQQGDPDDLGEVTTRDLGPADDVETSLDARIRRLRRRIDFFRPGSDTAFLTLPESAAKAIMTRPEQAVERLDFIARWRSGELAGDALIAAAREIFIEEQGHSLVLGGGDIVRREAFDAFLEAKDRIEQGEDADAVLAALMPSLIPQAYQDPAALEGLVLDMLPIIGDVRAAAQILEDIETFRTASAKGDTDRQIRAAAVTGISLLGFLPVVGVLFKNARITVKNYLRRPDVAHKLRNDPRLKTVHSRLLLPRRASEAVGESDRASPAVVFGDVWDDFDAEQQDTIRSLFSHIRGQATEKEFRTLLRNAGFDLVDEQYLRTVMTSKGARIFDQGSRDGFNVFFRTFVLPKKGGRGTLLENKPLGSDGPKLQSDKNKEIRAKLDRGEEVSTKKARRKKNGKKQQNDEVREQIEIEDFLILRADIKDIPEEFLVEKTRALLRKHTLPGEEGEPPLLTNENVDQLVDALRSWHAEARVDPKVNMNIGQALMMLGGAANQLAEINRSEWQNSRVMGPLGA